LADYVHYDAVGVKFPFYYHISNPSHPLPSQKSSNWKFGDMWGKLGIGWRGGIHQIPSHPQTTRGWKNQTSKQGLSAGDQVRGRGIWRWWNQRGGRDDIGQIWMGMRGEGIRVWFRTFAWVLPEDAPGRFGNHNFGPMEYSWPFVDLHFGLLRFVLIHKTPFSISASKCNVFFVFLLKKNKVFSISCEITITIA
jgi:hypothetical protein